MARDHAARHGTAAVASLIFTACYSEKCMLVKWTLTTFRIGIAKRNIGCARSVCLSPPAPPPPHAYTLLHEPECKFKEWYALLGWFAIGVYMYEFRCYCNDTPKRPSAHLQWNKINGNIYFISHFISLQMCGQSYAFAVYTYAYAAIVTKATQILENYSKVHN